LVEFGAKKPGTRGIVKATLKSPKLIDGTYFISIWFGSSFQEYLVEHDCININIQGMTNQKQYNPNLVGNVLPDCKWEFIDE